MNLDKKQSKIVANYVNAILYNDKIVSDIMDEFKDDEAIVFYLSDHGEEVYDFRDFAGHSDTMASRYMVEISFMIYVSSQLKQNRPDIIKKIQNAQNLPFMSDDFIHAFMDITGIKSKDFNNTRSLFDNAFNASRKRFYSGKDYDLELKP
nr:sulfatase-like hydrolase/transferase [Campylobacter hyointestinalis]